MNRKPLFLLRILLCVEACLCCQAAWASDYFSVQKVELQYKKSVLDKIAMTQKKGAPPFVPGVVALVETRELTRSDALYAKAYFFDENGKLLASEAAGMPVIFPKQKPVPLLFPGLPQLAGHEWKAVVVFGDSHEAAATAYPGGILSGIDYPEKCIVEGRTGGSIERKPALDPLIEYPVKTSNPQQPRITLLLRAPDGVTDPAQLQGVMALCLIGNSSADIKRQLQQVNVGTDVSSMIGFANSHKLAILCWGTGPYLWNEAASYDELSSQQNIAYGKQFDEVADGWERGVKELQQKYGLPDHNYLLVGLCGSAQWAHRLAMRKPDYFLAAYLHVPTSFDAPRPEASKMLWLLTTGELDYGYTHSIRFYQACHKMGYPMIFKPIMGLGHAVSPIAENLATKFFEYALTVKDQREAYDKAHYDPMGRPTGNVTPGTGPWLDSFRNPQFYGDYLNQECYPVTQSGMIPEALRVPLPTKELADFWNK